MFLDKYKERLENTKLQPKIGSIFNSLDNKFSSDEIVFLMRGKFNRNEYLFLNSMQVELYNYADLNSQGHLRKINEVIDILLSEKTKNLSAYYDSMVELVSLKGGNLKALNILFIVYIHIGFKAIKKSIL